MNTQCTISSQCRILDAVEIVLSWGLSDDGFADVVGDQADLMAGRYFE